MPEWPAVCAQGLRLLPRGSVGVMNAAFVHGVSDLTPPSRGVPPQLGARSARRPGGAKDRPASLSPGNNASSRPQPRSDSPRFRPATLPPATPAGSGMCGAVNTACNTPPHPSAPDPASTPRDAPAPAAASLAGQLCLPYMARS